MNSAMPPDDSLNSPSALPDPSSAKAKHEQVVREPYLAMPADKPIPFDEKTLPPVLSQRHLGMKVGNWWLPLGLFVATCVSTFFAGAMTWEPYEVFGDLLQFYFEPFFGLPRKTPEQVAMSVRQDVLRFAGQGGIYMVCVLAILFAHEMGHYIMTRIYKIPSTLPYFIPFPVAPIGTMGAVIAMKGQQANRKEIFDIGIAGPLAGLVLAIPIVWYGVAQMQPASVAGAGAYRYDLPLLVRWIYSIQHPGAPAITEVFANQVTPMFMAGWVGLLITGLNMMPVSQLDGGHVTYTLFGQNSRWIARVFVAVALAYMLWYRVFIWMLMLILVLLIGIYHPRTSDDNVPLGRGRIALGLVSLLIPVLCFPPRGLMPF